METQEGNELMMAVRNGELDCLGALFEEYHGSLIGYFKKMGKATEVAEDLAQDTFWRILKYRRSYDAKRPFRAWMFQIARNVMYDEAKRASKRTSLHEAAAADPLEKFGRSASDVKAEVDLSERKELLRRALDRLAPEKRELIVLCRFQELPYAEIASIFGCSVGALKVRLFRALQELKESFLEVGGERAL